MAGARPGYRHHDCSAGPPPVGRARVRNCAGNLAAVGGVYAGASKSCHRSGQGRSSMRKVLLFTLPLLLALLPVAAISDDSLVKFDGGIGVIPVSSGVGTAATAEVVNRNIVRGVQPPGQIWVIADLKANVKTDGRIKVDGKGLLLGGGNGIGTNGNQSVRARLFCGTDVHQTAL